jgi:hypothetical protein
MSKTSRQQMTRPLLSRRFIITMMIFIILSCYVTVDATNVHTNATKLPAFHHADSTLLLHDYAHHTNLRAQYSLMKKQVTENILNEFVMIQKVENASRARRTYAQANHSRQHDIRCTE